MVTSIAFQRPMGVGESPYPHGEQLYQTAKKTFLLNAFLFIGSQLLSFCPKIHSVSRDKLSVGLFTVKVIMAIKTWNSFKALNLARTLRNGVSLPSHRTPCLERGSTLMFEGSQSIMWKKNLIETAKHHVIISGSFCEGTHYSEILEILLKRLENTPSFQVLLIACHTSLSTESTLLLKKIHSNFPERFHLVTTQPTLLKFPNEYKLSNNHIKAVCIDFGRYFLVGSSNIDDHSLPRKKERSFWNRLISDHFLELDTIHYSPHPNGNGFYVYQNLLKLARRWQGISHSGVPEKDLPKLSLPKFSSSGDILSHLTPFHQHPCTSYGNTRVYFSTPEHHHSFALEALVKKINQAREHIYLCELYFHPPNVLLNALVQAAKRGVKIELLTNKYKKAHNGYAQKLFGNVNVIKLKRLLSSIPLDRRERVHAYLLNLPFPPSHTLHTKTVIIDECVIHGSGNLGHKSLISLSDYEIFIFTQSKPLAQHCIKMIEQLVPNEYRERMKSSTWQLSDLFYSITYHAFKRVID